MTVPTAKTLRGFKPLNTYRTVVSWSLPWSQAQALSWHCQRSPPSPEGEEVRHSGCGQSACPRVHWSLSHQSPCAQRYTQSAQSNFLSGLFVEAEPCIYFVTSLCNDLHSLVKMMEYHPVSSFPHDNDKRFHMCGYDRGCGCNGCKPSKEVC